MGHIDVALVADHEVHRHIEGIFDVMSERDLRQEGEFHQPGAVLVGIGPDMLAEATVAV